MTGLDCAHERELERAASACLVAMDAAGRSAACCLADPTLTVSPQTSESAIVAARLLGAFADVATLDVSGPRTEVTAALVRATLVAPEACGTANAGVGLETCEAAAEACTAAASELRHLLASTSPADQRTTPMASANMRRTPEMSRVSRVRPEADGGTARPWSTELPGCGRQFCPGAQAVSGLTPSLMVTRQLGPERPLALTPPMVPV